LNHPNPYDKRYGAWGHIADVDGDQKSAYSGDNSVDVVLDMGVYLRHIPVVSREWVITKAVSGADYTTGERDLPPPNSRVFVMMPTGTFDDCFVLCSGFSPTDKNDNTPFADEDTEKIRERIKQGGWHTIYDCVAGTYEIISPDGKSSIKIDYGTWEEAKDKPELHLKLFDNVKIDIIEDDFAKLEVFDEMIIEHTRGDGIKINAYDTETIIKDGTLDITTTEETVNVKANKEETVAGTAKYSSADTDIESAAPVGINDGLYKTGLQPYLNAETSAVTALGQAAQLAAPQLSILDGMSGGIGTIIGLGAAIVAFCEAVKAMDATAHTFISKAVK
jgi:hypothetical protein